MFDPFFGFSQDEIYNDMMELQEIAEQNIAVGVLSTLEEAIERLNIDF